MLNKSEFFKLFNIPARKDCYYWDCPYSTGNPVEDIPLAERYCNECPCPGQDVYPEISYKMLLELITVLVKLDFSPILKSCDLDKLEEEIVELCVKNYKFLQDNELFHLVDDFEKEVRQVFGYGGLE